MELIIDKGFLTEFSEMNASEAHKPVLNSFYNFIKKLRPGFKLRSNFNSFEELQLAVLENPLLELIIEKLPEPEYITQDFQKVIAQLPFYESGSGFKLFFVKKSSSDCSFLERSFGFSYINGADMATKWKRFITDKEISRFIISNKQEFSEEEKFNSWSKFSVCQHPVNSIIIADKYILSNKYEQKIQHNLLPLLKQTIGNHKNKLPVQLTIIAQQRECKRPFEQVKNELESNFADAFPETTIDLTLIDVDDRVIAKLKNEFGSDFHDRRIITSYYLFESGKGFNIFKNHRELAASNSRMFFQFLLYGANQTDARFLLEEYAFISSIATEVYGSNQNRLLNQFQLQNTKPVVATST